MWSPLCTCQKKIEIVIPSLTRGKTLFWSKKWFSTILRTFEAVECNFWNFEKYRWWYPVVPPLHLTKKLKLSYPVFYEPKNIVLIKEMLFNNFRTFEAVECNFWNFAKLVGGILWSLLCPWQKKLKFIYKFLRVEKHCFDQRNGFQQFLERLKQLNAISEILKKLVGGILWSPLCPWQKKLKFIYKFLRVEKHCFDQRNGFQQFLERLKQLNAISEILQNSLVVSCGPPFALDKKNRNLYISFYEWKNIVLIKEMVFNNFRTFQAVECNFWNFAKLVDGILWSPLWTWQQKLKLSYPLFMSRKTLLWSKKWFSTIFRTFETV